MGNNFSVISTDLSFTAVMGFRTASYNTLLPHFIVTGSILL